MRGAFEAGSGEGLLRADRPRSVTMMTESSAPGAAATDSEILQELTREEPHDMILREPMLRLGERLGVSSSYLTRVPERLFCGTGTFRSLRPAGWQ